MNEETIKLIRDLAAKLGTTSEHLWEVMVRQAPISSITNMIALALWLAIAAVTFKWVQKQEEWAEEARIIAMVLIGISAVVVSIMAMCELESIASGFFNPEYWALHRFIKS